MSEAVIGETPVLWLLEVVKIKKKLSIISNNPFWYFAAVSFYFCYFCKNIPIKWVSDRSMGKAHPFHSSHDRVHRRIIFAPVRHSVTLIKRADSFEFSKIDRQHVQNGPLPSEDRHFLSLDNSFVRANWRLLLQNNKNRIEKYYF